VRCSDLHRATLSLAREQRAPAMARMFVRARLADWLGSDSQGKFTDDLLLVTSELVTNAVVHGQAPIELTLALDGDVAEVTVTNFGGGRPQVQSSEADADRGRGLPLVDALVDDWGVLQGDHQAGKTSVWLRLRRG
jgi:anti-sigma regulatory factor (Ser/Thr protein kinase)